MRLPHNELGIAAERQSLETAPPVRAHDDEIGRPLSCLLHDFIGDAAAERFDQLRLTGHVGLPHSSRHVRGP